MTERFYVSEGIFRLNMRNLRKVTVECKSDFRFARFSQIFKKVFPKSNDPRIIKYAFLVAKYIIHHKRKDKYYRPLAMYLKTHHTWSRIARGYGVTAEKLEKKGANFPLSIFSRRYLKVRKEPSAVLVDYKSSKKELKEAMDTIEKFIAASGHKDWATDVEKVIPIRLKEWWKPYSIRFENGTFKGIQGGSFDKGMANFLNLALTNENFKQQNETFKDVFIRTPNFFSDCVTYSGADKYDLLKSQKLTPERALRFFVTIYDEYKKGTIQDEKIAALIRSGYNKLVS